MKDAIQREREKRHELEDSLERMKDRLSNTEHALANTIQTILKECEGKSTIAFPQTNSNG